MTEELPKGWVWAMIDDLQAPEPRAVTDGPFGSNLASRHYTDSGARVVRLQNIGDGSFINERAYISLEHFEGLRKHEVREGDIVIASLGNDLPRAAIVPDLGGPAVVKADCIRFRPSPSISSAWIVYALRAPHSKASVQERIRGIGRPRLGLGEIRKIKVPVPPVAEQHRIVAALEAELSRLDAADGQLAQAEARLVNLRARFVEDTCLGRGRDNTEISAKLAPAAVDDGMVPILPAGWEWKRLQEVADVVSGVTKDARKQSDPNCVEVPYLRVANVQKGALDLTRVNTIRVPPEKALQLELLPGDVLLNEGGDRDKLGRGWVWEGQIPGCIHQNHVFRARVRDGAIHPKLLSWHANEFGQRWCQANGKQSVNLASISMSKIRLLPIPVPPEEEQAELVKKLETAMSVFDRTAEQLASARAKAAALRQALLTTAFTGKLVPQDPADEPASALLDRLKAERATVPAPKRGRRTATSKTTGAPVRTSPVAPTSNTDDPQPVHAGEQTALEF